MILLRARSVNYFKLHLNFNGDVTRNMTTISSSVTRHYVFELDSKWRYLKERKNSFLLKIARVFFRLKSNNDRKIGKKFKCSWRQEGPFYQPIGLMHKSSSSLCLIEKYIFTDIFLNKLAGYFFFEWFKLLLWHIIEKLHIFVVT